MTTRTVEVRKYKWPDRLIDSADEIVLGDDEHGRWHGIRAGTVARLATGGTQSVPSDAVFLYPRGRWWCAAFNPDGSVYEMEVYVHICEPPRTIDGALAFVDLELDVVRYRDGRVEIKDEAEFVEKRFPPAVERPARAACDEVVRMLRERAEPFDAVGARCLGRFVSGEFA